jgi:hypothetical protein
MGDKAVMTRLKLAFVNAVIVLGAIAIAILQWPEAVKNSGFGASGYNQGLTGTIMLAVLMAGIPIVLFAAAAYLALTHVLFRRGELDDYRKRKIIESVCAEAKAATATQPSGEATHNSLN